MRDKEKPYLGELEKIIALGIIGLGNEADGASIRRRLKERANRDVSVGALFATLDRMEEKGFLDSKLGPATARTGSRQVKRYSVDAAGQRALEESGRVERSLLGGVDMPGWKVAGGVA